MRPFWNLKIPRSQWCQWCHSLHNTMVKPPPHVCRDAVMNLPTPLPMLWRCHIFNSVWTWNFIVVIDERITDLFTKSYFISLSIYKSAKGLGYSSVGRVLALPHSSWVWAPELPCKMLGMVLHACDPSAEKEEIEGPGTCWPTSLAYLSSFCGTWGCFGCPYACTHMNIHIPTHMCIHTCQSLKSILA